MPFLMTYYTNIFSKVMYPRSSNLNFDFVFLKMLYFNFFEKNILCACNYYLKHLQISSWDCNGIGFCEAFYCEESLHLSIQFYFIAVVKINNSNVFIVKSN
jgi:hypothetical protein